MCKEKSQGWVVLITSDGDFYVGGQLTCPRATRLFLRFVCICFSSCLGVHRSVALTHCLRAGGFGSSFLFSLGCGGGQSHVALSVRFVSIVLCCDPKSHRCNCRQHGKKPEHRNEHKALSQAVCSPLTLLDPPALRGGQVLGSLQLLLLLMRFFRHLSVPQRAGGVKKVPLQVVQDQVSTPEQYLSFLDPRVPARQQ